VGDLVEGTLADLWTLTSRPPRLRRANTQLLKPVAPAAGAGYAYKIDGAWWERILAVAVTLQTSATAGARQLSIAYADADGFIFDTVPLIGYLGASTTLTAFADQAPNSDLSYGLSAAGYGEVTSPGAAAQIAATGNVNPGEYLAQWQVEVSGTLTAGTDNDNMRLMVNGGVVSTAVYPAVAGSYPQDPVGLLIPALTNAQVKTNAAATTGAVYSANLTLTPQGTGGPWGTLPDITLKSGWQLQVNVANVQAGDQLSGIGILTERYASNYADGSLASDEENLARAIARAIRDLG
jgi:hypothetical protein